MHEAPRVLLLLPRYRATLHALFPGVAFLAGALRASGCEVAVFDDDVTACFSDEEGEAETLLREVCRDFAPTMAGIYVNTPNYKQALKLSRMIERVADIPLVAGGPHVTLAGEGMLDRHDCFFALLWGEGEELLPALAWALAEAPSREALPSQLIQSAVQHAIPLIPTEGQSGCSSGISFRGDSIRTHWFLPPDLKKIASPYRKGFLQPPAEALALYVRQRYRENFFHAIPAFSGRDVITTHVSRGCVGNCPFCVPSVLGRSPLSGLPTRRVRPVASVEQELKEALELGFSAWYFDEPAFPLRGGERWGAALMEMLRGLGCPWGCVARLDEIQKADMAAWHEAGLRYVYFGLETPQVALQEGLGKTVYPDTAIEMSERLYDMGIQCDLSVFFGMPGETEQSVAASLDWLSARLPRGNVFFSLAAYWPGTPWSRSAGLTPECWEPDFPHESIADKVCWYPEDSPGIERFFSNSTGTYHPASLTVEKALAIRKLIEESGLRRRFIECSRKLQGRSS